MSATFSALLFAYALIGQTAEEQAAGHGEATTEAPMYEPFDAMPDGPPTEDGSTVAAEAAADAVMSARLAIGITFWENSIWEVREIAHSCYLTNRGVSVTYDHRLKRVEVSFIDDSIKSLQRGQKRPIRLMWVKGDDGYYGETISMEALPVPDDNPTVTIMRGRAGREDFLGNFARMSGIGFQTTSGVVINGWSLEGSATAISQLRQCAELVSLKRPSDPFAQ